MSHIATVRYTGDLHSDLAHLQSGDVIGTDASTDNNGMGEAFPPADLLAASLGACAMTIMGIKATDLGADLVGARAEVVKEMAANSRHVAKVTVDFYLSKDSDERSRKLLETAAHTYPVTQNLNAELAQGLRFHYK